jgi:hypothetical protein
MAKAWDKPFPIEQDASARLEVSNTIRETYLETYRVAVFTFAFYVLAFV